MASRYCYRCEHCGTAMPMSRGAYETLTDSYGRLLCPLCRAEVPVAGMPSSSRIQSISTPRSIARDLTHQSRRRGNSRRLTDPYAVERVLLGKIGRLDLLPREAALDAQVNS